MSQSCSVGFICGLRASQSRIYTYGCAREAVVSHVVWGVALPWPYTKFRPKHPFSGETYYRGEAWCSFGDWGYHPASPIHSCNHNGWHPIPWPRGHGYCLWFGYTNLPVSPLPVAHTTLNMAVKQRESRLIIEDSASSAWSPTFCAFSLTHNGVAWDPKSILNTWRET